MFAGLSPHMRCISSHHFAVIMSPLYKGGDILLYPHRSFGRHNTVLCLCVLSVYHAGGQTRDVDPMPGYCWPTVYDAEPVLGYRVMFDDTLNVGQRHRRRANINPAFVFDLNRPTNLKNKQKTAARQALVLTNVGPLSTMLAQS